MKHRGIVIVGFEDDYDGLQAAIEKLDLEKISELSNKKGFTVRDVDMLIQEMAAYDYYFREGKDGLKWGAKNFLRILKNSLGSTREDGTAEFVLGDRALFEDAKSEGGKPKSLFLKG